MSDLHAVTQYQKYFEWCERMSVPAATYETWRRITGRIPSTHYAFEPTCAAGRHHSLRRPSVSLGNGARHEFALQGEA